MNLVKYHNKAINLDQQPTEHIQSSLASSMLHLVVWRLAAAQ